ncbi:unnamed protein product, partial [Laminaria digitata]
MGKSFDKRLRELGSEPFHTPAFADEATNMEEVVEPWLASLIPALEGLVADKGSGATTTTTQAAGAAGAAAATPATATAAATATQATQAAAGGAAAAGT